MTSKTSFNPVTALNNWRFKQVSRAAKEEKTSELDSSPSSFQTDHFEGSSESSPGVNLSKVRDHLKAKHSAEKAFSFLTKVAVAGGLTVGLGAALTGTGGLAAVAAAPLIKMGGAALVSGIVGAGSQLLRGIFSHSKAKSAMFESQKPQRQKEILQERISDRENGADFLNTTAVSSCAVMAFGIALGAYPVTIAAGAVCYASNGIRLAHRVLNGRDEKKIRQLNKQIYGR